MRGLQKPGKLRRTFVPALVIIAASFHTPSAAQTLQRLYRFQNELPSPNGGLAIGPGGVLYGTTYDGGAGGNGTVFALTPPASPGGAWTETTVFEFGSTGPANPVSGVTIGSDGVLYGTTLSGGALDQGTVYSLTPPASPGSTWTETILHTFDSTSGTDGAAPYAGVTIGSNGELYGTTAFGGRLNSGTVYQLTPPSSPGGTWTETLIYETPALYTPANPYGGVVAASNGVLYGTAFELYEYFGGAVYSLVPPSSPGGAWTMTTLHEFTTTGDGSCPYAGLAVDSGGVLYGTTFYGGTSTACTNGCGAVFSITPSSSGTYATEAVLYSFTGGNDGSSPQATLAIGPDGKLYGTTEGGGNPRGGTIFSLTPPTQEGGVWTYKLLYSFNGTTNGDWPSPLVIGKGSLYGTTYAYPSAVFELHP